MGLRRSGVLAVAIMLGAWGCTGPTVRTDFDPAADFSTFQTYAFAGMTDVNQAGVLDNTLVRKRIDQLVTRELSNKGLREVGLGDNPDLLVHYWVGLKEKQRVESTGPTVGAYGRRGPYGWGAGYGGVTTYDYTEGTLIVDLATPSKQELVWRASLIGTLNDSTEDNFELVNKGLAKAFADYPPKRSSP